MQQTLWNYDTENRTENFCHSETTWKSHKNIYKENHSDNHTEIFSIVVQGHLNHTEKF